MPTFLSVIVPVRNGGLAFARCSSALAASDYPDSEVIVVDDGSRDGTPEVAQQYGFRLVRLGTQSEGPTTAPWGPAAGRNRGAHEARGEVLVFLDADVAVQPDTLRRIAAAFDSDPELTALFGSYDDSPSERNFLSQFRNLLHHFVHQSSQEQASTFWAGCGGVRKEAFFAVGGFDENLYRRPSIEDIDLGYRLVRKSGRIGLVKDLQVKHLKRWGVLNLLRTDILDRGIPWARLLWGESLLPRPVGAPGLLDLNLQRASRLSLVLTYWLALVSTLSLLLPGRPRLVSFPMALISLVALVWLNRRLYRFFLRRRGAVFLAAAFLWHLFYFLYGGASFVLGTLLYFWSRSASRDRAPFPAPQLNDEG